MTSRGRSSISQHSRSISQYISTSDADELTDDELVKQVNELKHQIKILTLENEILEKCIMRIDPSLMHGILQALEYAFKLHGSSSSLNLGSFAKSTSKFGMLESLASPSRLLTSPSRISTRRVESSARMGTGIFAAGPKINVLERSELVSMEMEILVRRLERSRAKAARQQALLKAQLEELGLRSVEIEKATEAFNQQVIIEGWDKIAQRIPAEVWIRYMTDWFRVSDKEIGKLRLRTSTLNTQYTKLKGQIKVKAELSESLRPVDFEKLKIENQQCLELIESKLHQLAELKKMTGDANLNLAIHKKLMMEQNAYLMKVQKDILQKKQLVINLDKEREKIEDQADTLQDKYNDVKKVRLAYEVPDIMEYVRVKSEVADLRHVVKMLDNRFHVQQIALKSLNRKLHSMFFE
ncbi:coiled-coil domain-containing protein 113-like [Pectinophora gossypiella]|uniref:coiled-coil domain-containing protein 113-like n=1 Tax=Pectinophora gossypiella TaxID=13191 RepID=UPI00214E5F04|nr:coiled-coil domain-containing protein 113-like [Pectinophora gossypiella]